MHLLCLDYRIGGVQNLVHCCFDAVGLQPVFKEFAAHIVINDNGDPAQVLIVERPPQTKTVCIRNALSEVSTWPCQHSEVNGDHRPYSPAALRFA
jgi:hypothetical protein